MVVGSFWLKRNQDLPFCNNTECFEM